jgi:hypothetical protein
MSNCVSQFWHVIWSQEKAPLICSVYAPDGDKGWFFSYGYNPTFMGNSHQGEIFIMLPVLGLASCALFWADMRLNSEIGKTARVSLVRKTTCKEAASIFGKASWAKGVYRSMVEHTTCKRHKMVIWQWQVENLLTSTKVHKRAMALNITKMPKKGQKKN